MKTLISVFRGNDREEKLRWAALLMAAFLFAKVFGFVYETIFYYFDCGKLLRRGSMFLPMVPIYGFGSLLVILTSYDLRRSPLKVLLVGGLSCGLLEFVTGYLMFHLGNGYRAWDYNVEILNWGNIGGYVCARSVAFFAVSSLFLIYVVLPIMTLLARRIGTKRFFTVAAVLFGITMADFVYNYVIASALHLPTARGFYASLGWMSE